MIGNEVSDYKQLKKIRERIGSDLKKKLLLKSLYHCGSKVPTINGKAAVAVVVNKKQAKFVGTSSCKSAWGCPVCTARQMAKYGAKIACAIDALKKQGLSAAMITFTVPHTSGFSCEQVTEIAYNVWKAFTVHGNGKQASNPNDIFAKFMATFNSKHRVRVTEYTFGKAGWHPHFHCMFWFPTEKIQEILDWEDKLCTRWLELCKRYTIRQFLIGYPETQRKTVKAKVEARVNIMYAKLNDVSRPVYISKADGKVIIQKSSDYICGWGGDKEVTGNYKEKATAEGHYTWQQILQLACDTGSDEWWNLYFEYMEATRKQRHARVNFSAHSGLSQIIAAYRQTEEFKILVKKNRTSQVETLGRWKTVCWFNSAQWNEICNKDLEPVILTLAMANDAEKLIAELLAKNHIPPPIKNEAEAAKLEAVLNAA